MTAIQTLKSGRASAAKDAEKARKAHAKLEAQIQALGKQFAASKAALEAAEKNLKAIDSALSGMGEAAPAAKAPKAAPAKAPKAAKVAKKAAKPAKVAKAAPKVEKKAAAAKAPKAVKAKPAKAPKAEKKGKKSWGSRQAAGRREVADGLRPTFKDAIVKVMGNKAMTRDQVHDALKEKGWLPNSNEPRGYVGYMLSASKVKVTDASGKETETHLFDRVKRGVYKVRQDGAPVAAPEKTEAAPVKAAKAPAKRAAKTAAKAAPAAKAPEVTNGKSSEKSADEILREAGLDSASPFGG